jgi:hypothetical protein
MKESYDAANAAKEIPQNKTRMNEEEVDRVFEKQEKYDEEVERNSQKNALEIERQQWVDRRRNARDFTDDPLEKQKRRKQNRKHSLEATRLKVVERQRNLHKIRVREHDEIIKEGILSGHIEIHETPNGYMIDTDPVKVKDYVLQKLRIKNMLPRTDDLETGQFLLDCVPEWQREQLKAIRRRLIEEYGQAPTTLMLIDNVIANYIRVMYATHMEMGMLWHQDCDYETFELAQAGLQPYIRDCQTQLIKSLNALKATRQGRLGNSMSMQVTYRRTDLNLQKWGLPLLHALDDVASDRKEIDLDEVKLAMKRYANGLDVNSVRNSDIAYAMNELGFVNKIHTEHGNRYIVRKEEVEVLLKRTEDLKA